VFPSSAVSFPTQLDRVETANLNVSEGKIVLSENQGRLLLEKLISASASQEIFRIL
jgi:hypothetical protein